MSAMNVRIGMFLIAAAAAPVSAMRLDQQQAGPPTTAAAEVTQCGQAQMVVDQLLAAAMARMEEARQANAAADLRAAVDSLQATVREARAQLAPCASMQPAAGAPGGHMMPMPPAAPGAKPPDPPMDHSKMPMGTAPAVTPATGGKSAAPVPMDHSKMQMGSAPAAKPAKGAKSQAPTAPMDHSKMPTGTPPEGSAQAVDPVCGLNVDPATAPRATHQGHTYSFCSEQHRQLFQKNPAKFLPKGR